MKRTIFTISLLNTLFAAVVFTPTLHAKAAPRGLVEVQWLEAHHADPDVVVLDVRSNQEYAAGHIENSVNVPFAMPTSAWVDFGPTGLWMELPAWTKLSGELGNAGIRKQSTVVVVGATQAEGVPPSYPLAQTARVADTLIYAGVQHVTILDGGITAWAAQYTLSTVPTTPSPVVFNGTPREDMFATKHHVEQSLGKTDVLLLDARDSNVYQGLITEPFAPRAGHIPGAKSLPAPSIWAADGKYVGPNVLQGLVSSVWSGALSDDIIVYCGVGGYASGWWFVLSEVLGHQNVKFYDGSAQEWTADPNAPLEMGL